VATGAHAPKSGALQQAFTAHRIPNKEIPNFAQVTPNLYRGGQPSEKGLKKISEMGINIIVDVRGAGKAERKQAGELGMQYVAIPWHCPFPKDDVFAKFIALVRSNPNKKIFVHCRLGDDRGGMMIASYRMAEQGWTAKKAMTEMQDFGFTGSHHFICPGLASYEEKFPERFKTSPAFDGLR
jgi:protein tyrosine/serine phosphatase